MSVTAKDKRQAHFMDFRIITLTAYDSAQNIVQVGKQVAVGLIKQLCQRQQLQSPPGKFRVSPRKQNIYMALSNLAEKLTRLVLEMHKEADSLLLQKLQ